MNGLPDWQDDQGMLAWLMAKLDDQLEAEVATANARGDPDGTIRAWLASDGPAIEAAELHDDVTKLRERYPHLARFIHPMKLPPGPHRPTPRRQTIDHAFRVRAAAADVPRIRKLWRQHYKRRNRRQGFEKPPEFFAARRCGVSEADVRRKLKRM